MVRHPLTNVMIFKSLARANEIGANSYLVDTGSARVVLDAGMHPKEEGASSIPHFASLDPDSIDGAIITHAHLDHAGTLPLLLENQQRASAYMTPATSQLAMALLHNSVNVMGSKRVELGITEYPFFTHRDLDAMEEKIIPRRLETTFAIDKNNSLHATFYDAGHILGSAAVLLESDEKRILYTGDVQFEDQTLLTGAKLPEDEGLDALIIETTRGAYERPTAFSRQQEEERLAECILQALERGGSALLPVFAMGKTQEVLTMLYNFKREGLIPDAPIYIGGLSTKMTLIFDDFASTTSRRLPGFEILKDMELQGVRRKPKKGRRAPMVYKPGCIFALSSGMMTEKTVSNVFARDFLPNPKNSLLFVGYADPATPAAAIRRSDRGDTINLDPILPPVPLNCEVNEFDFSGHAVREDLLAYILRTKPKKIFLVHGDLEALQWFEKQLADKLPSSEVIVPKPLMDYII